MSAQLKLWSLYYFKEKEQQRNTQSNKLCKLRFEVAASTLSRMWETHKVDAR